MRGLWLRLLRGGGRSARLEIALPLAAGAVITFVLLLLLALQQGLDHRAERTAWRTPEAATGEPVAVQGGYTAYFDEHPVQVVELAALSADPPALPGMGRFPGEGEVWVSPALAELLDEEPADRLGDRLPGRVTAELAPGLLEHPDERVAVVGLAPDDPAMGEERAPHQWNAASSVTPTKIEGWSTTPDLYATTYRDIALLVTVLTALPLVGLGGLASRLMAGRRQRRLATLRLLGAETSQVVRMTTAELASLASVGALCGIAVHQALLPLTARVPVKGGGWFPSDVQPGLWGSAGIAAAVVAVLTLGALTGLVPAVRDPLGAYRRSSHDAVRTRLWSLLFLAAAVALFWLRSSNPFVSAAFTAVVILGWGLVSMGPLLIAGLGHLLAKGARGPTVLLAGRQLADSPRSAWRTVGGMSLAAFIAGFVAISLPVGLGNVGTYAEGAGRLEAVVPAANGSAVVQEADAALREAGVDATAELTAAPSWLREDEWVTLSVPVTDPDDQERARTALTADGLWGPEMRLAEDLPNVWLVRDGVTMGFLVLPTAALVALASMMIGTLARIYEQRETLLALRLAGTPGKVLRSAQRHQTTLPTALLAPAAAVGGLASGATLGSASLLNPYTPGIFAGIAALGVLALVLADRTARPVLEQVSADLSERG